MLNVTLAIANLFKIKNAKYKVDIEVKNIYQCSQILL